MNCEVCGAPDRTCGHQELVLPVVDLAAHGAPMKKREIPRLVRPSLPRNRGVAGWRNAIVIEPGTDGIPLAPEPPDVDIEPELERAPEPVPAAIVLVDRTVFGAEPEIAPKRSRRRKA